MVFAILFHSFFDVFVSHLDVASPDGPIDLDVYPRIFVIRQIVFHPPESTISIKKEL